MMRFRWIKQIGEGGHGDIWLADDVINGCRVVVKCRFLGAWDRWILTSIPPLRDRLILPTQPPFVQPFGSA